MQRIWHRDRTMNGGGTFEISYVWYDETICMNGVCTALDELFYYFIVIQYSSRTLSCSTVAQDSIVIQESEHDLHISWWHPTNTQSIIPSYALVRESWDDSSIYSPLSKKRKFGSGLSIKIPDGAHIPMRCVSGGEHDHNQHMKYHHSWSDEGAESGDSTNENVSAPLWNHRHRHRWHLMIQQPHEQQQPPRQKPLVVVLMVTRKPKQVHVMALPTR